MGQQLIDMSSLTHSIDRMISLFNKPAFLFNRQGFILGHNHSFSKSVDRPNENCRSTRLTEMGLSEESLFQMCENAFVDGTDITIELKRKNDETIVLKVNLIEIPFLNEELFLAYCPENIQPSHLRKKPCLLYTSDAADEEDSVDL